MQQDGNIKLDKYLELLENTIDPCFEDMKLAQWQDFLNFKQFDPFFAFETGKDDAEFPKIPINQTFKSYELMLLSELRNCYKCSKQKLNQIMNIRPNYGTGILPTLFDSQLFMLDDEADTLPSVKPIGRDKIKKLLFSGEPELTSGLGSKVLEATQFYLDTIRHYPKIKKYVWIYHPDLQGPIDVCELLWGSEIFISFYDEPDLIDDILSLITQTYIKFMNKWYSIVGFKNPQYSSHWGYLQRGKVLLRNDSLMNLSPEIYEDLIVKYDQMILNEFGGGIHFCGKADHCINEMIGFKNLTWIHISQPEYNDMEMIIKKTRQAEIPLAVGARAGTYTTHIDKGVSFYV